MVPIEFLRQFRIDGYAIFDVAAAFIGIYLLAPLLSKLFLKIRVEIPKRNRLFLTLPMAIVVHLLVGNITPMTSDFFDIHGHYILKIVIVISLIFGCKDIHII
jgi:hypothetical protein